jgi:hypothetical protein
MTMIVMSNTGTIMKNLNKKCSKCCKKKSKIEFNKRKSATDGLQNICRECQKQNNKLFYSKNKFYYTLRYKENKLKILNHNKLWNKNNKESTIAHKKKFNKNHPEYYKEYRTKNKNKLNEKLRTRAKQRRKCDPIFKIKTNYRNRLYDYYKGTNRSKKSKEIIGLEWHEFKSYIESKFEKNMSWENYGEWHIDHIIPLSSARSELELEKLFHYTNCQPLWASDNLRKSAKVFPHA